MIALVGRPNVGKSSLFNRLLRRSAALVDDRPGVTRDRHVARLVIEGREGLLVDTGGFEFSDVDPLAGPITAQIRAALERCDLAVLVVDGLSGLHPQDAEMARILRQEGLKVVVAVNKLDRPQDFDASLEFHGLGLEKMFPVSAAHGTGVEELRAALFESLEPTKADDDDADAPPPPPRVAVIGRPNAGKSSLINRLVGEDRLVVDARPGTTRDAIEVPLESGGKPYALVDTAGVRRRGRVGERLEKLSVMRAIEGIERADVAVLVVDALEGLAEQDAHIAGYAHERGRPMIILLNKWDAVPDKEATRGNIAREMDLKLVFLADAPVMTVSAMTGAGLKKLFPTVDRLMAQYVFRASTADVNKVLREALAAHTPPFVGPRRPKFFYAAQVATRPPTFVAFADRPEAVHFSYKRYLVNRLKDAFGLDLVPVVLRIRSRRDEERSGRPRKPSQARPAPVSRTLESRGPDAPEAASDRELARELERSAPAGQKRAAPGRASLPKPAAPGPAARVPPVKAAPRKARLSDTDLFDGDLFDDDAPKAGPPKARVGHSKAGSATSGAPSAKLPGAKPRPAAAKLPGAKADLPKPKAPPVGRPKAATTPKAGTAKDQAAPFTGRNKAKSPKKKTPGRKRTGRQPKK
jgi:GTP-binding protein